MEKVEKERKQKLSLRFVLTRTEIENSKKIAKKLKKTKEHLYGFISSQYRLKRLRKGEDKKYRFVSSLLNA